MIIKWEKNLLRVSQGGAELGLVLLRHIHRVERATLGLTDFQLLGSSLLDSSWWEQGGEFPISAK